MFVQSLVEHVIFCTIYRTHWSSTIFGRGKRARQGSRGWEDGGMGSVTGSAMLRSLLHYFMASEISWLAGDQGKVGLCRCLILCRLGADIEREFNSFISRSSDTN